MACPLSLAVGQTRTTAPTPESFLAFVQKAGPDSALRAMPAGSRAWHVVLRHLEAADTTWYPVSAALVPKYDWSAEQMEEMGDAEITGLPKSPAAVFTWHLNHGWTSGKIAASFCSGAPSSAPDEAKFLQRVQAEVQKIDSPALAEVRQACLDSLAGALMRN